MYNSLHHIKKQTKIQIVVYYHKYEYVLYVQYVSFVNISGRSC